MTIGRACLLVVLGTVGCRDREPAARRSPSTGTLMTAEASTAPGDAAVARDAVHDARLDAPTDTALSLAADLAERTVAARARFGPTTRIRTVDDTYVLVEAGPQSTLFDTSEALLQRALPAFFADRFTTHPTRAVTVLFFPTAAPYRAYSREHFGDVPPALGVYLRGPREIAVDLSGGAAFITTLTHEVVHSSLETDFSDAPRWFNEGLASLFEVPTFTADGGIHGVPRDWRQATLTAAFASPAERSRARLDVLFGMSARTFIGDPEHSSAAAAAHDEALHYALARSFCAWLDGQGKLWAFYHAWRDGYVSDETGEKAFAKVMGGTPKERNGAWETWAR